MSLDDFQIDDQSALFEAGKRVTGPALAERFVVPPISVLDKRQGYWLERRRAWLSLGIKGELGRESRTYGGFTNPAFGDGSSTGRLTEAWGETNTSIFDPVLCELAYRWFTAPGARVLDPFAGGSVRGIVAGMLGRRYFGIDLSGEQVAANREQAEHLDLVAPTYERPVWRVGDSVQEVQQLEGHFDLVFTCPPYADLERYSDDPHDLSTMTLPDFEAALSTVVKGSLRALAQNSFAAVVMGDARGTDGLYYNLVGMTIAAFERAGAGLYNQAVVLDRAGTAGARAARQFEASRKMVVTHQHLLVFLKGDAKLATARAAA